jgi:hypothetical protein
VTETNRRGTEHRLQGVPESIELHTRGIQHIGAEQQDICSKRAWSISSHVVAPTSSALVVGPSRRSCAVALGGAEPVGDSRKLPNSPR